jgi:hypothetical protein
MIKFNVNNGRTIELNQFEDDWKVYVGTYMNGCNEDIYTISPADMVMLLNYYRYIKNNDIQCDFINPNGTK